MMERARLLPDVIHLEVGEPDFPTPPHVVEAAVRAAREGATRYTPTAGLPSLRTAIARHFAASGIPATAEQVVVTPGAVFGLATALLAVTDPGDEVLVPDPGWPNYVSALRAIDGTPVPYPLRREAGYVPTVDDLASRVTGRTRALILNTPANPTGAVFPRETVEALVRFARDAGLVVISDEVYEAFVYEGAHTRAARFDVDGRVVTVSGCSKTYAMTGWRVGYVLATAELAEAMTRLAEPFISCPSAVAQHAAEAALTGPQDGVAQMRDAYRARRDLVVTLLGAAGLLASTPRGAFYALIDLSRVSRNSLAVAERLLEETRVATAPGETFGRQGAGLLRLSFAAPAALLEEGCRRIIAFGRGDIAA
jgi:aspartate aminotransferase/aminotransferase